MVMSPKDFIEKHGDAAAVAAQLGLDPGAVRLWKFRNELPKSRWAELMRAYPELELEQLQAMQRFRRPRQAA
jgi:hypothetical protein